MQKLRSILFTLIMFFTVAPLSFAVILARPFGAVASYDITVMWCRMITWVCSLLCHIDYTVEGEENIPNKNCVVFLKHSSTYETITQWLLLPRQTWVIKRELMRAPFLGWGLACLRPIAIDRSAHRATFKQVIEQGKGRLADGLWVLIYP